MYVSINIYKAALSASSFITHSLLHNISSTIFAWREVMYVRRSDGIFFYRRYHLIDQ